MFRRGRLAPGRPPPQHARSCGARQSGKIIRFWGEFTCNAGDLRAGTFEVSELEPTAHGLTGYLRKMGPGPGGALEEFGRFAATPL